VRDWILEKTRRKGILCIVDEVFIDFCEEESLKVYLEESPNLLLIRSMTKFYGVPGLRLGYLLTSGELAERMKNALPPWSVSTLAQIGGVHALGQEAYREETLGLIARERAVLLKRLEAIQGLRVFPGRANYLLLELGGSLPPAAVLQRDLLDSHRIVVRDCSSFEGLGARHVRIAIRLPEQNARLMEGIEQWVESKRR
jgi:threonine-phosphate decarboxylase